MPKQQATQTKSDMATINKLYKGSWCDFADWNSWKNSKIAVDNIQLLLVNFDKGINSRQLRYAEVVGL